MSAAPRSTDVGQTRWSSRWLGRRQGGLFIALGWALLVGTLTRLALLVLSWAEVEPGLALLGMLARGVVADLAAAAWWLAPLALILAAFPRDFFARRWARGLARVGFVLLIASTLFVALAEWFFWDEFGVRFNFIAVDYLVYTTEVLGNIRESYPMGWVLGGLAAATAGLYAILARTGWIERWLDGASASAGRRWAEACVLTLIAAALSLGGALAPAPGFANAYLIELAGNGPASFVRAFWANSLDYEKFYPTLPEAEVFAALRADLDVAGDARDLRRTVPGRGPARPLNVVQITVESLSAEFLARYGNRAGLTPNLDALAGRSLVFDRLYATGTRTDRGMEALTLSTPPSPGRSLLKRPGNENLFTLGSVLAGRGYTTAFVYGGYGYFDNMNRFFAGNGYRVVDRASVAKSGVSFANAWGACDEDLLRWELREADLDHAAGQPFFHFVMTTSNHRPYTYPEGRIDLPPKVSRRAGAVKYTDYAIGEFLRAAATRPWYRDTIFVIVADHCASSAGKTSLPVNRYHIPLLIFAPGGQVKPGVVDKLSSQIDYAPTLLGLLGGDYESRFFGHDVLAPQDSGRPGRAWLGTYQNLGLFDGEQLAVLSPVRREATYAWDAGTGEQRPVPPDRSLLREAVAGYQVAGWLIKHGAQGALSDEVAVGRDEAAPSP